MDDLRLATTGTGCGSEGGGCACGETGQGFVLIAPHDPLPLLAQLEERAPEVFAVDYLERGPQAWRLSLVRQA